MPVSVKFPVDEYGMKVCSTCRERLPEHMFGLTSTGELRARCKRCAAARLAAWRERVGGPSKRKPYSEMRQFYKDALSIFSEDE